MLKKLFSYGIGEGVAKGLNIAVILLLPLFISVENYGLSSLIIAFEQLLMAVFLLGQNITILRFYDRFKKVEVKFINSVMFGYFKVSGFFLVITFVLILLVLAGQELEYYKLYLICAASAFLITLQELYLVFLRAKKQVHKFIFLRIFYQLLKFIFVLGLAYFNFEEQSYALGVMGAIILSLLACLYTFTKEYKNKYTFSINTKLTNKMLYFGAPLIVHGVIVIIYGIIDRYMINWYINEESVAVYSFFYAIGSSVFFIINIFTLTFLPELFESKILDHKTEKMLRKYLFLTAAVVIFASVIIYFAASSFIVPAYYPDYISGLPILGFILLSVIIHPLYLYGFFKLTLLKMVKFIPWITATALIVNVVLNIQFIPEYGILGAAITTLISAAYLAFVITFTAVYQGLKRRP